MGIESPIHLVFIGIVALLVLGPRRLPEVARRLGDGVREFRAAIDAGSEGHDAPEPVTATPVAGTATQPVDVTETADVTQAVDVTQVADVASATTTETHPATAAQPAGGAPAATTATPPPDTTAAASPRPPAPGEAPPPA